MCHSSWNCVETLIMNFHIDDAEYFQVRQKNWQESSSSAAPRVSKPRVRGKRPFVAPTTVNPTTEVNTDQPYQQNSFNKDFYNKKTTNDTKSSPEKV